ncbi:hypothetical protein P3T35_008032 [Kitasatospora sp. GP30]|uniref:hypothetical protein n=1 Tax=Kitasatospora sp. GP30 TaxID=3035084 RepID=UPI000C713CFE|nr:hypothetical protein [Kitasatospora sp. GP30]MDH6145970.1 hypothetical protein [Kitasatospora sp. GP30]
MTDHQEHDQAAGLSPDVAYGLAPALAYELYHLLERVAEQHKPDGEDQDERLLLVRQAALADRCQLADPDDLDLGRAEMLAWQLRSYDEKHGTTEGPIPAEHERWDRHPFGYVRQEYHQWAAYAPLPGTPGSE